MKKILGIILILSGVIFSKEKIKLEKGEHISRFYAVVYKIEGNKLYLGENGEINLTKSINDILIDTLENKITLNKIEYPALFEIEAITSGIHETIEEIIKNIKEVLSLKYVGGKEKAEEYIKYLKELEKQFER
ncbi:MAG: hypothetical protein ABIM29_03210 [candidate division WOR-3 bacterium]